MTSDQDAQAVQRFEHETWSRCADGYMDGFAGLTRETLPPLIEAAGLGAGYDVLEIGSGPGHIAAALAETGASVTGIDFSGSMVETARQRYPQLTFEEADAEDLPFADGHFDAVVSNFVVHHLARPEAVFKEVCRVLKPGGRFAFAVFADPAAQSSFGAFFGAIEEHHSLDELPHGPLFGVTDLALYERLLHAGGLGDCRFDFNGITWRTKTLDPVVQSLWSWGNMAALNQELQDRIEASTRENMQGFQQKGGFAFAHEALIGSASRP